MFSNCLQILTHYTIALDLSCVQIFLKSAQRFKSYTNKREGVYVGQRVYFLEFCISRICRFCQKSADSATFGSNKIAKNKKIKNLLVISLLNMPKIIYTKNWTILGKIEGGVDFFARSWGINFFFCRVGKKRGFSPKNRQIFGEIFQKFPIQ